ncbi:LysR family transcriptional regulator [Sphingobium sp.]|uniref:LysR family transcriptional regulator n=1 Tax=Sphingobium sp. TaxID=1912891 RepID=UPI003B3B295B
MTQPDELFRTVSRLAPSELAAFEAVARHGGFRAAARATGASASALSHAVAGLERRVGAQLLLRSSRNVSLTQAGQALLSVLRPAVQQIAEAVQQINARDAQPSGLIRLNASTASIEQVMESLLIPFLRSAPLVRIEIQGDAALVDIAEGRFDCGIRLLDQAPADMIAIPVGAPTQQHIVVGAPAYLEKAPSLSMPSDLAMHQCIQLRLSPGTVYRWEFTHDDKSFTVRTHGPLIVDSSRLALQAAVGGLGLAYVTRWLAADALNAGHVVQLLDEWTPPYPGLGLYYPRNRHINPAMRAFVDYLRARYVEKGADR